MFTRFWKKYPIKHLGWHFRPIMSSSKGQSIAISFKGQVRASKRGVPIKRYSLWNSFFVLPQTQITIWYFYNDTWKSIAGEIPQTLFLHPSNPLASGAVFLRHQYFLQAFLAFHVSASFAKEIDKNNIEDLNEWMNEWINEWILSLT